MFSVKHSNPQSNESFALIELMTVMAIIGVLAAIAVPNFMTYRDEAYLAASLASGVRGALAAAAADDPDNSYPLDAAITNPSDLNQYGANLRDEAFQSFTYKQLDNGGSYQVAIVTFGGKEVCMKPEGITKASCR
jgi:prepilin-type N-terminal cleavage/methylation domain-containing protein